MAKEVVPATKKKEAFKPKKNPWPVLLILAFFVAFFSFGALMFAVHPEFESAIMSQKQTEQNFVASMVTEAPKFASEFPTYQVVPFKTWQGDDTARPVIMNGYSVDLAGVKCVQYHQMMDQAGTISKDLQMKQACVVPVKEVKAVSNEPSWISKVKDEVLSWKIWNQVADFAHSGHYFYQ